MKKCLSCSDVISSYGRHKKCGRCRYSQEKMQRKEDYTIRKAMSKRGLKHKRIPDPEFPVPGVVYKSGKPFFPLREEGV